MKIVQLCAFRTVTKSFNSGRDYLQMFEYAEETVKKVLRESNNEFDEKFDDYYKILNNRPSVSYSHQPTFMYVTDTRRNKFYVFNMEKDVYTWYDKIETICTPNENDDYYDTNQILPKFYDIKSTQNYPLDQDVYVFSDISVEMQIVNNRADSHMRGVKRDASMSSRIGPPAIISHLKQNGCLLKHKSEYPVGMEVEAECSIL